MIQAIIKINVEKKPDLNIAIKDTKLSSGDKKTFSKIKKLLLSRDINKIDLGVELLISLNSPDLFNILLDGCKLETKHGSEPNYFESNFIPIKFLQEQDPLNPF